MKRKAIMGAILAGIIGIGVSGCSVLESPYNTPEKNAAREAKMVKYREAEQKHYDEAVKAKAELVAYEKKIKNQKNYKPLTEYK